MRDLRLKALIVATGVMLALPIGAMGEPERVHHRKQPRAQGTGTATPDIASFTGLGAWIDMFDRKPWKYPEAVVRDMAKHGTQTLYLQTSNYSQESPIFKAPKLSRLLEAAHSKGIKVVAWYVPNFRNIDRDLKRVKAALNFESVAGEKFDAFGLDIEATIVDNILIRNTRTIKLSKRIRTLAGPEYPLSAIIPDPAGQTYWPFFPYEALDAYYDAFLPMGYYTFRATGYKKVFRYTRDNIKIIREGTGDPATPVHAIGGLAGDAPRRDVQAFVDATVATNAVGGSLYDYSIMEPWEWTKLQPLKVAP